MRMVFVLSLIFIFITTPVLSFAEISKGTSISSDNFRILDSQHSIFGGTASSSSSTFILTATMGDFAIGSSSITNFGLRSGFLYYPKVVAPILHSAVAGNSTLFLSWIPAFAYQGFSVGGYNVCFKLTSGGTYSCQNVGNVIFLEKAGLTNASNYTFKIEAKDGLGNVIATSNEKSGTPASTAVAEATANTTLFDITASNTITLTNSNNTTAVFDFPQNFYSSNVQLVANSFANDYFASTKPVPSGKNFIGKTYDFGVIHSSTGDQISAISIPATITISYSSSDVSGFNESSLAPYRWGTSDSSWQLISGATINTTNKTITFSTANFSSFALFGTAASTPTPSSGGGGGGGGAGTSTGTTTVVTTSAGTGSIIIRGTAYPNSTVSVYNDGILATSIKADGSAKFDIKLEKISTGNRVIGISSTDSNGRKSITVSFNVIIGNNTIITLTDVLLAPTIDLSSFRLAKGDKLRIFGQSAPISEVNVHVASEETVTKAITDSNGAYAIIFDTKPLAEDDHTAKSRSILEKIVSPFSHVLQFTVGKGGLLKSANLNKDGRVNIIDFSILLFWWNTSQPKGLSIADINGDKKVNIVDFSIMLFQWSG